MGKWNDLAPWESQVLAALSVGDVQRAMEARVLGYQHAVVGYCTHMLGGATPEEVEEVAQDVFLAAYQALPRFQQQASIRTWLFTIAHHRCVTYRSRARCHSQMALDHNTDVVDAVHPHRPGSPEVDLLEAAREMKAEKQRELVSQSLQRLKKTVQRPPPDVLLQNWLRVLSTTEMPQIDQCICHQFHPVVPLLDVLEPEQ